jgi:chromate reductase
VTERTAQLTVCGIAGSLRQASYNRALLRAAQTLAPEGMQVVVCDLSLIPFYNADQDGEVKPEPVVALKEAINRADALLFVTPEYNHSIPGVLKNAIDWASRPAGRSPLAGKPAAIMGASQGVWGTVRAQAHLRQVLAATRTQVLLKPEVLVAHAAQKFDAHGQLIDESTRARVRELLIALAEWTHRLRSADEPYLLAFDETAE